MLINSIHPTPDEESCAHDRIQPRTSTRWQLRCRDRILYYPWFLGTRTALEHVFSTIHKKKRRRAANRERRTSDLSHWNNPTLSTRFQRIIILILRNARGVARRSLSVPPCNRQSRFGAWYSKPEKLHRGCFLRSSTSLLLLILLSAIRAWKGARDRRTEASRGGETKGRENGKDKRETERGIGSPVK